MLKKLLECLDTYLECINNNFYDVESYKKTADAAKEDILELKRQISHNTELNSFNFPKLKREIAIIFHPDHYKEINEFITNPIEAAKTFFGSFDEVVSYIKSGNILIPSDYIDINFNNEKKQKSDDVNSNEKKKKKSDVKEEIKVKEDVEDDEDEMYYADSIIHTSLFEAIQMGFSHIVKRIKKIPTSEEEYDKLLNYYNNRINNFTNSLSVYEEAAHNVDVNIRDNEICLANSIDPDTISIDYNRLVNKLSSDYNYYSFCANKRLNALNSIVSQLRPVLQPVFSSELEQWQQNRARDYSTRDNLIANIQYHRQWGIQNGLNELIQQYNEINKRIYENYDSVAGNIVGKIEHSVIMWISKNHDSMSRNIINNIGQETINATIDYSFFWDEYNILSEKVEKVRFEYNNATINPQSKMDEIKRSKEAPYLKRRKELEEERRSYTELIDSLSIKLQKEKEKKERLIDDYSDEFGEPQHKKSKKPGSK